MHNDNGKIGIFIYLVMSNYTIRGKVYLKA